tara:strand:+ start:249 stop:842 length:594 start_codon:yes stop_codon:yes gene_type:complete
MTENTLYSQNNNGFIRPIVKSQLLMELKTENFAINESVINLSENYLLTEYSKKLDETLITLLSLGEFEGKWDKKRFNEFIFTPQRQKGSKIILENNKAIAVTFASGAIFEKNEVGRLDFVVTHPEYRNEGLSTIVCTEVIKYLIKNNYEKIILQTDDWRIPAIAVYFKLGFKPVLINKESKIRWNKIINNNFKNLKL